MIPGEYKQTIIILIKDYTTKVIEDNFPKFFKGDTGKVKKIMLVNVEMYRYDEDGTSFLVPQSIAIDYIIDKQWLIDRSFKFSRVFTDIINNSTQISYEQKGN